MTIPAVRDQLPEMWDLVRSLRAAVTTGAVASVDEFVARCRTYFTSRRMEEIDARIPGWAHMASFADGKTLWHVMVALVALLDIDEYQTAVEERQRALEWAVLLHDLAKEPTSGRDHRHAIRSAAAAGRVVHNCGLPVTSAYATKFDAWFNLTDTAHRYDESLGDEVQDNAKMADVLAGARQLFPSPTYQIVASIALHLSVTVLAAWPVPAPLPAGELRHLLEPDVRAVLEPLMLADSGGWNLFDRPTLTAMYAETRSVFREIPTGQ